jgi:G3E family GTPase
MPLDSTRWLTVVAVVVISFVITQLLVACLQRKRLQRIEEKSLALCGEANERKVPVTVVTGFLGSGKTTLVNRVLTADHGKRVVVIENELGSVSIDHALIDEERQKAAPHGVLVLKNGCMCCAGETPGSELERVLDKLLEMLRVEEGALAFDYVLIETSGLADVGPILQVLWRREMASAPFVLDGVVTLVDAKHIMRHLRAAPASAMSLLRRRPEAEKQLALADKVVLNKADLVTPHELDEVRGAVRACNTTAALLTAQRAAVPLEELLDLGAFTSARWEAALQQPPLGASHGASVSCACVRGAAVALPALQRWLQRLVDTRHEDLLRIKGLLEVAGYEHRFVMHGIHAQLQGQFDRPWRLDEERGSTLVFIGHRLDESELQQAFDACLALGGLGCEECAEEAEEAEGGGGQCEPVPTAASGLRRRGEA